MIYVAFIGILDASSSPTVKWPFQYLDLSRNYLAMLPTVKSQAAVQTLVPHRQNTGAPRRNTARCQHPPMSKSLVGPGTVDVNHDSSRSSPKFSELRVDRQVTPFQRRYGRSTHVRDQLRGIQVHFHQFSRQYSSHAHATSTQRLHG